MKDENFLLSDRNSTGFKTKVPYFLQLQILKSEDLLHFSVLSNSYDVKNVTLLGFWTVNGTK